MMSHYYIWLCVLLGVLVSRILLSFASDLLVLPTSVSLIFAAVGFCLGMKIGIRLMLWREGIDPNQIECVEPKRRLS